jgi:hypothetical protein
MEAIAMPLQWEDRPDILSTPRFSLLLRCNRRFQADKNQMAPDDTTVGRTPTYWVRKPRIVSCGARARKLAVFVSIE